MAQPEDVTTTPKASRRSPVRSIGSATSSFADFSPIEAVDLEALDTIEQRLTQAMPQRSVSGVKRKREEDSSPTKARSPSNGSVKRRKPSPSRPSSPTKAKSPLSNKTRAPLSDVTPANVLIPPRQSSSRKEPTDEEDEFADFDLPLEAFRSQTPPKATKTHEPDEYDNELDSLAIPEFEPQLLSCPPKPPPKASPHESHDEYDDLLNDDIPADLFPYPGMDYPSPAKPPRSSVHDPDIDSFFNPSSLISPDEMPSFVSASFSRPSKDGSKASMKVIKPSENALRKARKMMEEVEKAEEEEPLEAKAEREVKPKAPSVSTSFGSKAPTTASKELPTLPPRPAFPASRPSLPPSRPRSSLGASLVPTKPAYAPRKSDPGLMAPPAGPIASTSTAEDDTTSEFSDSSLLHPPARQISKLSTSAPVAKPTSSTPMPTTSNILMGDTSLSSTAAITTLSTTSSAAVTPRHLGMRSRPRGGARGGFATPWKSGGQAPHSSNSTLKSTVSTTNVGTSINYGHTSLGGASAFSTPSGPSIPYPVASTSTASTSASRQPTRKEVDKKRYIEPLSDSVFDLNPPSSTPSYIPPRQSLSSLGLPPRKRDMAKAVEAGVPEAVGDTDTWNALYWQFEEPIPETEEMRSRGCNDAFDELKRRGCKLVSKEWVENHWVLIVWKLANMVCAFPDSQGGRWGFEEVVTQLLYRYEREINRCQRPPIRLIQERDASPNAAMVLCVFEIQWPEASTDATAKQTASKPAFSKSNPATSKSAPLVCPELVLTDGWYKIRAQVDAPLARAVEARKIRPGTKLQILNARLNTQKKDADEVLKSFNSSWLSITGNGCHLARWDEKLGWMEKAPMSNLNAVLKDGGSIGQMLLRIHTVCPLAFHLEDGREIYEEEEAQLRAEWEKKRSSLEAKLRDDVMKKLEQFESIIERLEDVAGESMARVRASEDGAPEDAEDLADELEIATNPGTLIKGVDPLTAAWASTLLRSRYGAKMEEVEAEIQGELETECPPRKTQSYRILVVRDAFVGKGSRWDCQLTIRNAEEIGNVWDGGKVYLFTNLIPHMPNYWCGGDKNQMFLCTRRDTRWKRLNLS